MGIFFDQDWFDDRLKAAGLTHAAMAQAAGMTIDEIDMVFRDQRELESPEVHAIARALSADPREVATRAGVPDPGAAPKQVSRPERGGGLQGPEFVVTREVIAGIHERMDRLERLIEVVIQKVDRLR
jgi:transcriptional regulator with XRE-family HTH domain